MRPSMEYVAEVWETEGCSACKKLKSLRVKMGRKQ